MEKIAAIVKAIFITIFAGAMVIASFFSAYVLIVLVVMVGVGGIAYLYFTHQNKIDWNEYL